MPTSGRDPSPSPQTSLITIADLYEHFETSLRRYAVSLAHDSDRADDLVQETFIRAWAHLQLLGQLNPHQRRAWLYRVLKNLFLDRERARQRQQALVQQLARERAFTTHPSLTLTSPGLLDRVPERYRELLHQRYILGMTSTEIGRQLGIPAATVRSRLHLAIKWLRAHPSQLL